MNELPQFVIHAVMNEFLQFIIHAVMNELPQFIIHAVMNGNVQVVFGCPCYSSAKRGMRHHLFDMPGATPKPSPLQGYLANKKTPTRRTLQ